MSTCKPSKSPTQILITTVVWLLLSVFWLDVSWGRIADLRAAGKYISPMRYMQVGFWVLIPIFWLVNGWFNWKRYKATAAESKQLQAQT